MIAAAGEPVAPDEKSRTTGRPAKSAAAVMRMALPGRAPPHVGSIGPGEAIASAQDAEQDGDCAPQAEVLHRLAGAVGHRGQVDLRDRRRSTASPPTMAEGEGAEPGLEVPLTRLVLVGQEAAQAVPPRPGPEERGDDARTPDTSLNIFVGSWASSASIWNAKEPSQQPAPAIARTEGDKGAVPKGRGGRKRAPTGSRSDDYPRSFTSHIGLWPAR